MRRQLSAENRKVRHNCWTFIPPPLHSWTGPGACEGSSGGGSLATGCRTAALAQADQGSSQLWVELGLKGEMSPPGQQRILGRTRTSLSQRDLCLDMGPGAPGELRILGVPLRT